MNNKILIAAEIFPPAIGGPATYTVELANALVKRGFEVRILCYGRPDKKVLVPGIKINWVSNNWPLPLKYLLYFIKLSWSAFRYEAIYAMGPVAAGLPAMLLKKLTGKKLIVKVVGDYAWEQAFGGGYTNLMLDDFQLPHPNHLPVSSTGQALNKERGSGGKIGWLQKIERLVCEVADIVITPSQYLKCIVDKWGIKEDKIKVIYNFFDWQKNYGIISRKDARRKFNFSEGDFVIISVGRAVVWKGFGLLALSVADLIQNNNLPIKLRILGVNSKEEIIRMIKLYNDKVIYEKQPVNENQDAIILRVADEAAVGLQPKDKVYEYLKAADVFVLNSGYEGLSHAILEAFACGVPVVTTNVGGNPELVKNNENGLLVPYNDQEALKAAIIKLHQEPALREKFVKNAQRVLEKFTFEAMVEKTIEVIS